MAFISRLSSWFERMFDTSESADVFEEEGAEGFLMTAAKEAPPVLPQLRTGNVAPAEPPEFRLPSARPVAQAEPAVVEPAAFAAEEEVDASELEEQADEDIAETALDAPIAAEQPAAFEEEPASGDVQALPATDPAPAQAETSAAQSEPVDMLSMFRSTTTEAESKGLTKDIEDVTGADLLQEAREVRDLLLPGGSKTDNAA